MHPLSLDLEDDNARPYFLWDEDLTIGELRNRLTTGPQHERLRLLGKLLREARDDHVWRFTTPEEVVSCFAQLEPYLGRRRAFWQYLLKGWRADGLIK
jgi:hypothetical protein